MQISQLFLIYLSVVLILASGILRFLGTSIIVNIINSQRVSGSLGHLIEGPVPLAHQAPVPCDV